MADRRVDATAPRRGTATDWLVGGGEMAEVIQAIDWSKTPLGPIASWPQSLRTAVSLAQASLTPIALVWGRGHVLLYNDGYWPICGAKHPDSMGQDFRECWADAFPIIGEAYRSAWAGRSACFENMRMFLNRNGFLEETCFTFSLSPVTDESGRVGGVFNPAIEMTSQMLSERRARTLRELPARTAKATTSAEAYALAIEVLEGASLDVPFVLLYELDPGGHVARLAGEAGVAAGTAISPEVVPLHGEGSPWPIGEIARARASREVDIAERLFAGQHVGPYPEAPRTAIMAPITQPGSEVPSAVIVMGVSARLHLSEPYRTFYDMVAAIVAAALVNARAHEEARRKVEALAAIDRTKTDFFSNVSHEFRTPLTLILGPLDDALSRSAAIEGESLKALHRNAVRLLRLVNSLLDFARIEAARAQASPEPTDLSALTIGLVGSFRSLVESGGLTLVIDCPQACEPAYVDRIHWEKIVLNLVSNAFKFTFEGTISVRLRVADERAVLEVTDTGTGIPEGELSRVFERFHRVDGARGRSFEGTGIGLALVQELVGQSGGTVAVESSLGRGSTFRVSLPVGLPASEATLGGRRASSRRTVSVRPVASPSAPSPYLLEAEQWVTVEMKRLESVPANEVTPPSSPPPSRPPVQEAARGRVLLVDDNADMRLYIVRLLEPHWDVDVAADGIEALERMHELRPDLVLSDLMMPRADGFALLRAIRADPSIRSIPVVFLSARAGEEEVLGGLERGADDYLVKPFSARELLSRVRTHLEMARIRRLAEQAATELADTRADLLVDLQRKNRELEAFSYSLSHDLRAPLRSIDGFSQEIIEDYAEVLDAKALERLDRVRAAAHRMGELIDDLTTLSRVERATLQRARVDITGVARRVWTVIARGGAAHLAELSVQEGLSAEVDPRLAEVLIENLLTNAWKFTRKSTEPRVTLRAFQQDGETLFSVEDNGVGFEEAHASRLFTPFQRLHSETDFPGTGIGLAIVHRIVERHGGSIQAKGRVDRGATFSFTLCPGKREGA
jgi:signal transduction histidine kinase